MAQDCGGKVGAGDMWPKIAGVKWGQEICGPRLRGLSGGRRHVAQDCGGKVGAGDMWPKIAGVKWGQETCGPRLRG